MPIKMLSAIPTQFWVIKAKHVIYFRFDFGRCSLAQLDSQRSHAFFLFQGIYQETSILWFMALVCLVFSSVWCATSVQTWLAFETFVHNSFALSSSFFALLLTLFFSTAWRKWWGRGRNKEWHLFLSWLILRQLLCPSQWCSVIDADRGVRLSPGPQGCTLVWAQDPDQPSSSKQLLCVQTAFDFLPLRCQLRNRPWQMCACVSMCSSVAQPKGYWARTRVGGCFSRCFFFFFYCLTLTKAS